MQQQQQQTGRRQRPQPASARRAEPEYVEREYVERGVRVLVAVRRTPPQTLEGFTI